MASVLDEYLRYRQMAKSDQPPSIFISSMVGPIKSKYLQPCLLTVEEVGSSINRFEFLPQRDSIAVLLYHRQKRQFLLVRRFRPAVAASHVLQLPRNKGKALGEINWADCEEENEDEIGWIVELCSGRVKSKKENLDETALAVVEEQFGLRVDKKYLQHIGSFLTGVKDSGASCHLYYAELDCAEEISEGKIGSNPIMRVYWMDVAKMMKLIRLEEECLMPSSHFYACLWWLPKYETINKENMKMTPNYGVDTRCPFSDRRRFRLECRNGLLKGKWRLSEKKGKLRYPLMRLNYTINNPSESSWPSFHTRDITMKPDTVSILIKDVDSKEIVMTRRSRPAALVGRVMAVPENETSESASSSIYSKYVVPSTPWTSSPHPIANLPTPPSSPRPVPSTPEQLDFSSYVSPWAYTFEENETRESVHSSMNWKTQSMSPYPFAHLLTPPPSSSLPLPSALEQLDFSSHPNSWAYTYELASARIDIGQDVERAARNVALRELGYAVTAKDIKFIGKVMIGSSEGGESKYLYYAECRANHRVRGWKDVKGVERVKLPLLTYEMFIQPSNSPPSVHIALIVMNGSDEAKKPAIDDTKCAEWNMIERAWNESAVIESMEEELEKIVIQVAKDGMGNEEDEEDIDEMEMMNEKEEREWIDSIYSIESVDVVDSEDEKSVEGEEEEAKDDEVEVNEEETNWTEESFQCVDNQTDLITNSLSAPIDDEMTEEERNEQFGWADADDYLLH